MIQQPLILMSCPRQFEEIVADKNEELQTILHHNIDSLPSGNAIIRFCVSYSIMNLPFSFMYLPIFDKKTSLESL